MKAKQSVLILFLYPPIFHLILSQYAVGWKDGGLYLFHSVDKETDSGPYAKSQGLKLGVEGDGVSHGCIQLAIPDAKWFFEQLPTGTLVTINK